MSGPERKVLGNVAKLAKLNFYTTETDCQTTAAESAYILIMNKTLSPDWRAADSVARQSQPSWSYGDMCENVDVGRRISSCGKRMAVGLGLTRYFFSADTDVQW